MTKDIENVIIEYIGKYKGSFKTYSALADIIVKEGRIQKSHSTIRRYISEVDAKVNTENIDEYLIGAPLEGPIEDVPFHTIEDCPFSVDEDKPINGAELIGNDCSMDIFNQYSNLVFDHFDDKYIVKNLQYELLYNKTCINVSVKVVDKVFCAYSKKGMNLTKVQVQHYLKLDDNTLSAIFNRLNLTKDSEAYGPFTEEFMDAENKYSLIMLNVKELLRLDNETDSATVEALVKEYKKSYIELSNKNLRQDKFMQDIVDKLSILRSKPLPTTNITEAAPEVTVVLADMHLGLQLPIFNYDIARHKLYQIAADINALSASKVTVSFLGDTLHTFSGINHAGMWKTIEKDAWGANSIIKPFELLYEFFTMINNLTLITSVSGNHDRCLDDRELEESNEGAKLLFFMLKNSLSGVEVIHTDHRTIFDNGNLRFITLHGDQGLDKKSADKIVWKYGKQDKFNLILEGHWHSRIIDKESDTTSYRKMHCPAFAPTDDYAERLGLGATSGWLAITEKEGLPMVLDIPINYEHRNV